MIVVESDYKKYSQDPKVRELYYRSNPEDMDYLEFDDIDVIRALKGEEFLDSHLESSENELIF